MDQINKKVITISFLLAGVIVAYSTGTIIQLLEASISSFARLADNDIFTQGLPVVFGFVAFLYLQLNSKTHTWADEVVVEIRKMTWISMKDTTSVTIAVCIMVIISGLLLGVLDFISSKMIHYLISL